MIEFDPDRDMSTGQFKASQPMRGIMLACAIGAAFWALLGAIVWGLIP